jgi:hypothetical protein
MAILNLCQVLVLQNVFGKVELVPDGVLGGYCRGVGKWSCVIDHGCLGDNKKEFPPFLELLQKWFYKSLL